MHSVSPNAPEAQGAVAQLLSEAQRLLLHCHTSRAELVQIEAHLFSNPADRALFRANCGLYELRPDYSPDDVDAELSRQQEATPSGEEAQELAEARRLLAFDYGTEPKEQQPASRAKSLRFELKPALPKPRAPRRERRTEATPDEIKATAEAVQSKASGATFPELCAEQIPPPALQIGEKPEYDPHQLRELLRPHGTTVALDTEAAHAERAEQFIGADILFCPQLGFLHYDSWRGFWRQDDKEGRLTAAKLKALAPVVRAEAAALLRYAATLAGAGRDGDARAMSRAANGLLTHAKQVEKRAFLSGAATFLAAERRAEIEQFQPAAWKFAFKNRVFDCGQWRAARRDDLLLHVSPVALDRNADQGEWRALLDTITGADPDFAHTLQDVCAYALSGAATLRALPWFYGRAGTGKSTVCELSQTLLGEGAATVDPAHLTDRAQREKLGAVIWGKRAAFVSEAGNQRIEAELLKNLSGGDRLSVRFLYCEPFTAKPTHALIFAANDAPRTDAYDDALKERVLALPFVHRLDEGEPLRFEGHARVESARQDPDSALLRGFAAWVAEGLERLFETQEIYRAQAVKDATAQFWADTDELTPFWETQDEAELRAGVAVGELRQRYEKWCEAEKLRAIKGKTWANACKSRGLIQERQGDAENRTRFWFLTGKTGKTGPKTPEKPKSGPNGQNNPQNQQTLHESSFDMGSFSENTPYSVHSVHNEQNAPIFEGDEPTPNGYGHD